MCCYTDELQLKDIKKYKDMELQKADLQANLKQTLSIVIKSGQFFFLTVQKKSGCFIKKRSTPAG